MVLDTLSPVVFLLIRSNIADNVFLITLFTTRFVSLSSMLASVVFMVLILFIFKEKETSYRIFAIIVALMVVATHQKNIVTQWLEVIEMTHLRKKRFIDLSIGQQRVGLIVRAVLKHPPLLILDEPVEGLDDENVDLVIQLINTIKQQTNVTILYVSHRIEQGLAPTSVFELLPAPTGSIGSIKYHSEIN